MGFEFKIIAICDNAQLKDIQRILENDKNFDRNYSFDNKIFIEFRIPDNKGKMPDLSIAIEDDGIYICQHGSQYVWQGIEELQTYLSKEQIQYSIMDYQE